MICRWPGLMITFSPGLQLNFVGLLKHFEHTSFFFFFWPYLVACGILVS